MLVSLRIAEELLKFVCRDSEVPIVSTIVNYKTKKYESYTNLVFSECNPTAHSEIIAIRETCKKIGSLYLDDFDIYVTLEPCAMCAQAISYARIRRLYFGAYDHKSGGVEHGAMVFSRSTCHHKPEIIGGIHENSCATIMSDYFKFLRTNEL